MHTAIVHWGRKWPRPKNHLDGRVCPKCFTTVHGTHAQHAHQQWHLDLQAVIDILSGQGTPAPEQPVPWTAAVDEDDGQEAISDGSQEAS